MKLIYATTRKVPSDDAQSKQIFEMCSEFHNQLGSSFALLSPLVEDDFRPEFRNVTYKCLKNKLLRYLLGAFTLTRLILKEKKDVVVYTRDIGLAFTCSFLGVISIYEKHQSFKSSFGNILLGYLLKTPDFKLVCISKALSSFTVEHFGPANNIFVAHDGFNDQHYSPPLMQDRKVIIRSLIQKDYKTCAIHTGSLYKGRGVETFVHLAQIFPDVEFIQVGGKDEDFQRSKEQYSQIKNLHFLPRTTSEEVAKIQKSADILVYLLSTHSPVWWCTSPLKLFEYMAAGNPIFCSKCAPIEEVLSPNDSVMYELDNLQDIVKKFKHLLSLTTETKKNMSLHVQSKAFSDFTWKARVSNILREMFS